MGGEGGMEQCRTPIYRRGSASMECLPTLHVPYLWEEETGSALSRLIWTPFKFVPPGTNFSEIYGPPPPLKNLFPPACTFKFGSIACRPFHEGKSVPAVGLLEARRLAAPLFIPISFHRHLYFRVPRHHAPPAHSMRVRRRDTMSRLCA